MHNYLIKFGADYFSFFIEFFGIKVKTKHNYKKNSI